MFLNFLLFWFRFCVVVLFRSLSVWCCVFLLRMMVKVWFLVIVILICVCGVLLWFCRFMCSWVIVWCCCFLVVLIMLWCFLVVCMLGLLWCWFICWNWCVVIIRNVCCWLLLMLSCVWFWLLLICVSYCCRWMCNCLLLMFCNCFVLISWIWLLLRFGMSCKCVLSILFFFSIFLV